MTRCELYSADAVRFALADAGDSLEDANFERKRADSAVTMLFVEEIFARAAMRDPTVGKKDQLQLRDGELSYFVDRAFKNELGAMIAETLACYEGCGGATASRPAPLVCSCCATRIETGVPRVACRCTVVYLSIMLASRLLYWRPVCPHFSHHVWFDVLKEKSD